MKKIWGLLFTIVAILLAFQTTTVVKADGKFEIKNYHATADVQKNGDIDLTQQINYQFNGNFHGVYYNQSLDGIKGASRPEVYINDGYQTQKLTSSSSGDENTFKVSHDSEGMNIKVYHSATTEKLTFIYKYRLYGAVTNYLDTAELKWKMIGEGWDSSLYNVKLTVNLPEGNVPELQAWTHGPSNGYTSVQRKKGRVIMTLDYLPSHQFVETHMLFPSAVTSQNPNVVNKNEKKKALAQEKKLVEEANSNRERKEMIFRSLMIFGAIVIVIIYLYRFFSYKKNPGNKHVIPTPIYHIFDEPKFKPSFTKVILDRSDRADNISLTADLLEEVGKHRMKIDKFGSTYEITALVPPTNTFFKYLIEDIGDGKKVNLRQIKAAAQSYNNKDKMLHKFNHWAKEAAQGRDKYLDIENMNIVDDFRFSAIATNIIVFIMFMIGLIFGKNILAIGILAVITALVAWGLYFLAKRKITPYTDLGEDEVNRIRAFKRMLNDINDIKMAEVGDLILWEQFLPYAVAFGVSEKVIKALKVNFGVEEINSSSVAPYYIGAASFINVGSTGFQAAFTSAIGAGGSSSLSGGSGGFTGGSVGGFGGGSGGGAF